MPCAACAPGGGAGKARVGACPGTPVPYRVGWSRISYTPVFLVIPVIFLGVWGGAQAYFFIGRVLPLQNRLVSTVVAREFIGRHDFSALADPPPYNPGLTSNKLG